MLSKNRKSPLGYSKSKGLLHGILLILIAFQGSKVLIKIGYGLDPF